MADDAAPGARGGRGHRAASRQVPGGRGFAERTRGRPGTRKRQLRHDCMGMRNNRPCRLPARIASIEFNFRVEFKLSSNVCGACPDPGPSVYARCLGRPRMLSGRPRRRPTLRRVPPRASPSLSYWHDYQREYKTKGLPSDAMGGPFPQSFEFRCAGGLLVIDGPIDTEWYEF